MQTDYTEDQLLIIKYFYMDNLWSFDTTWDPYLFYNDRPFIEEAAELGLPNQPIEQGILVQGSDDEVVGFSETLLLKYPNSYITALQARWNRGIPVVIDPNYNSQLLWVIRDFYITDSWPLSLYTAEGKPEGGFSFMEYLNLPTEPFRELETYEESEPDYGSPSSTFYPEYDYSYTSPIRQSSPVFIP